MPRCRVCGAEASGLCRSCQATLDRTEQNLRLPKAQRERMLAIALGWAEKAPWLDVLKEPFLK